MSKALRFGLSEVQPGQTLTNAERIEDEMRDLLLVYRMPADTGLVVPIEHFTFAGRRAKVEKFLEYSEKCGTLSPEPGK